MHLWAVDERQVVLHCHLAGHKHGAAQHAAQEAWAGKGWGGAAAAVRALAADALSATTHALAPDQMFAQNQGP